MLYILCNKQMSVLLFLWIMFWYMRSFVACIHIIIVSYFLFYKSSITKLKSTKAFSYRQLLCPVLCARSLDQKPLLFVTPLPSPTQCSLHPLLKTGWSIIKETTKESYTVWYEVNTSLVSSKDLINQQYEFHLVKNRVMYLPS